VEGGSPMSPFIARRVLSLFKQINAPSKLIDSLTEREGEILQLLAEGIADKEIAQKLTVSFQTIRTHLRNIYRKLNVHNRTEAVLRYLKKS